MKRYQLEKLLERCSIEFEHYGTAMKFKLERVDSTIQLKFYMNDMLLDSITIGIIKINSVSSNDIMHYEIEYDNDYADKVKDFVQRWRDIISTSEVEIYANTTKVFSIIKENLIK